MIVCDQLIVRQGDFQLGPISLELNDYDYYVIMGPSGSGKTTLIETLLGLRPADSGAVLIDHRDVTRSDPAARQVGYVPQDGVLFPNMTVAENLAYGLQLRTFKTEQYRGQLEQRGRLSKQLATRMQGRSDYFKKRWIHFRVVELARQLGLAHLLHRMPQGLSGGERQRVALGRALAIRPRVLLLDEPLAALDEDNRQGMVELLRSVRERHQMVMVHITHSQSEAKALGDQIIRLKQGQLLLNPIPQPLEPTTAL